MTRYKGHVFAVSDSCYDEERKIFKPAAILHLQKSLENASTPMRLVEFFTDFQENLRLGVEPAEST